jgi:uncharacterized membrane protein
MDWKKEIIDVRKLYLTQRENSQIKLHDSLLIFSTSLILAPLKEEIPGYFSYIGIVLFISVVFLFAFMNKNRKKNFNKIELYIKNIK